MWWIVGRWFWSFEWGLGDGNGNQEAIQNREKMEGRWKMADGLRRTVTMVGKEIFHCKTPCFDCILCTSEARKRKKKYHTVQCPPFARNENELKKFKIFLSLQNPPPATNITNKHNQPTPRSSPPTSPSPHSPPPSP